jgi:hypothetical protein
MKIKTKILITIILAVLVSQAIQYFQSSPEEPSKATFDDLTEYLADRYEIYNSAYFKNELPENTVIDFSETRDTYVAITTKLPDGRFHIAFNKKYVRTPDFGDLILLHESCHIPTYDYYDEKYGYHGKEWRACMIELELQGAFHHVLIEGFGEDR